MTNEEIISNLKEILNTIKPSLDLSSVTPQTELIPELGLDSLSLLLLSLAIENKFGFTFEGTPHFATLGEVVSYINEKVN